MGTTRLKKIILRLTPEKVLNFYKSQDKKEFQKLDSYATLSYSQEGEDLILKRIFEGQETGFYIDVGAHHPKRFSNTYFFYKMGWKGINIDATPGSINEFLRIRPNDINLEKAISNKKELLKYYIFNEPALNTFSYEEAKKKDGLRDYRIIKEVKLETSTLSEVLSVYLNPSQKIDFLNIDVEGYDFKVLKSLDWNKYKPKVILIESLNSELAELDENEIYQFLKTKSYQLMAKSFNTFIFKKIL